MNRTIRATVLSATAWAALTGLTGCGGGESTGQAPQPAPTVVASIAATPSPAAAPAARRVGKPSRVVIPAIDVDEGLYGVGLNPDGSMETPDFGDAGWYDLGPRPGAPGPAVIVAHVHGPAATTYSQSSASSRQATG